MARTPQTGPGEGRGMAISLEQATAVIAAGEKRATELGVPMAIAVVDDGGNLKAQHRMDGASLAAIAVSLGKAYTSLATGSSTEALAAQCQPGQPLYGLQATHNAGLSSSEVASRCARRESWWGLWARAEEGWKRT